MADRYWVGGTASWDGTAGTKWSATSGGPGGASVPTSADDVFFNAASGAGTVTIAAGNTGARSINCTGFTGTIAGSAAISVAGSVTLVAAMTYTHSGTVSFTGTGTLTTAGKTFSGVTVNGAGITLTLGDALNISTRTLTITQGTFTTANFNVTAGDIVSTGVIVRAMNLGSSTIVLSSTAPFRPSGSNLTFNAGTSNIQLTSSVITSFGGALTFNNVSFTGTSVASRTIVDVNTYNNLTLSGPSAAGTVTYNMSNRQIINGTLSTTGTAGNRRVRITSDTYGISQILTINSTPSLVDVDFIDTIVQGTAVPISGTRIGNLGGCIGITFSAPKTVYWNPPVSTTIWGGDGWAATSGGAHNTDNFPLAQDTAVIDNSSAGSTILINTGSQIPIGTLDASTRTTAFTINFNQAGTVYGNFTLGSGISLTGTSTLTFSGRSTQTITSAGKSFSCPIVVDTYGGIVTLADALSMGSQTLTVTNGTFNTANFNLSAGRLVSDNTNVRTIILGSSTVSLNETIPINISTITNLTFGAGTSQINITGPGPTIQSGGLTFHNVSLTETGSNVTVITGSTNTFNNLSVTAPTSAIKTLSIQSNQTVTGTLTVVGASPIRRIFLRSDTFGTSRTLSVGTLVGTDCDFRDITIAGAAAGTAPTRAGNAGNNSGITFPAPKTVYWNLSASRNWSANGWALSSGGTPAVNNFPLAQDTAVFDNAGAAGTITVEQPWFVGSINGSARTNAVSFSFVSFPLVIANLTLGTGFSTFAAEMQGIGATQTVTTNGITMDSLIVEAPGSTIVLGDALTLSNSLFLFRGTLDAATYNVTTPLLDNNNTNTRTLKMGSGTWTLTGTGTVWNAGTVTNLTFEKGTANIVLSDNSTTDRTFAGGGLSYNKLTIGGNTSTSITTITGNNQFAELASTKTVAHTIALGTTVQTFGAWTVTGTVGNVVTLTGTGTLHIIAGAAVSGIDYLAMGSIAFSAASMGEFYAGANSTGTAGAPVYRTAKPADSIRYWVGGTGTWSSTARWSLSSGGAGGASIPRSHDDVVFNSGSNATAYTATVDTVTGGIRCKSLTITGPASGNLTLAGSAVMFIHNNVSLPATGLTRTYTGNITLTGSTTGRTFTTNGVALASTIAIDGVGCEWLLGSALNNGTSTVSVRNGTFDLANFNLTAGSLFSFETFITTANYNSRTIKLGSSTLTLSSSSAINFGTSSTVGESVARSLTFDAGTSQINCTSTSPSIVSASKTFHNVSLTSTAITSSTIAGIVIVGSAPTVFNNLTIAGRASAGVSNVTIDLPGTVVVNGTLTVSAGTDATCRTFIRSLTLGTAATITCAAFSGTDVDFRDITIAGAAAPISGTRFGDCRGNSSITFPAPKTVYWNLAGGGSWSATAWAATGGGTPAANNFPLAQDTCVFQATGLNSGASVSFDASFNVGTIDMSARTTNTMTLAVPSSTAATIHGNWINGTGVTLTSGAITSFLIFAGRGTQNITSAGVSFPIRFTINSPGGSVVMQDSLTYSSLSAFTLTTGTFNAAGFNFTYTSPGTFTATGSAARQLAFGSGTWTFTTAGGAFNAANTGLTVTGNGTITLTSGSAKSFGGGGVDYSGIILNQGGAGTLTIIGNNTFKDITATQTATSAATISLGTTTQRVTQFRGKGEATRLLTIQGTSAATPATLIYTGSGPATDTSVDYLSLLGVRAYPLTNTWYAGNNSINNGTLGWEFTSTPATTTSGNFLLFVMPRAA